MRLYHLGILSGASGIGLVLGFWTDNHVTAMLVGLAVGVFNGLAWSKFADPTPGDDDWRKIKAGDVEGRALSHPDAYELTYEGVTYRCRAGISPQYFEWFTRDGQRPTPEVHRKLGEAISSWRENLRSREPLWS